jgi:hypothetical protein
MKILGCLCLAASMFVAPPTAGSQELTLNAWVPIFNGKDLQGWTPKFTGSAVGENYRDTFRVEDGRLVVSYEGYETFEGQFGHLFYAKKLSHYRLRLEYRFLGEQTPGAPDWALMNSGIMFHAQAPETMSADQAFPVCVEAQILGDDGKRTSGNLCSPGTHVMMKGELVTEHCVRTSELTTPLGTWTSFEIEVHGGDSILHKLNGQVVTEYSQPTLDPSDPDAKGMLDRGIPTAVVDGYVALQAESHPVEFRNVELMLLDPR